MRAVAAGLLLFASSAAPGEVVTAGTNGFEVRESVIVATPANAAFAAFGHVESWWSGEHSFSGSAANLSLDLRPGGCFCERLPGGGGVQHMHVAYVEPGRRVLLTGSLGPLLFQATTGLMDVQFEADPKGTRVVLDYRAAGFFNGGADKIAPAVDAVLADQLKRYGAFLAKSR